MKRFSEFLREQEIKVPQSEIEEVDVVPEPQESEKKLESSWSKVVKDFKKTIKPPSYDSTKRMMQGDKELSKGAIELDMTPKPKVEAPIPEPQQQQTMG